MSFEFVTGKKVIPLIAGVIVWVFFGLQALFGFPTMTAFEKDIKDSARILIRVKLGTCVVEASDLVPRSISNCPYDEGDTITITYKRGAADINSHQLNTN